MAYRDSYGGFGGSSMTPWVKRLLIANTAVFLAVFVLENIARIPVVQYLAFRPRDFLTTPWTVLTYGFAHAGIWHLLGNLLVLYFFGAPLENRWGSRDFIKFYLVGIAGGALFSVVFYFMQPTLSVVGASAGTFALMAAFAMIWPDMEVHVWGIFPLKAKWLVGILAAITVLMLWQPTNVAVLAHLGGMVVAVAYLRSPWAPSGWGDVPRASPRRQPRRATALVPWAGKKPVVTASSAGTATQARPMPVRSAKAERELLDDVDRILDKISAEGLASLSEEERRRLDEVSRRFRTN